MAISTINYKDLTATSVVLYGKVDLSKQVRLHKESGSLIANLTTPGRSEYERTISNLSPNTSYIFYITEDYVEEGRVSFTTPSDSGGSGGVTPDPNPDPGGGTTPDPGGGNIGSQSWLLQSDYIITANSVSGSIKNNSTSLMMLNTVGIYFIDGTPIKSVDIRQLIAVGGKASFNITGLSLASGTYIIGVNGSVVAGYVVFNASPSGSKPTKFEWKTSTIQKGYPLKITASDWTLLQNKITEVYTYIKSANKPVWTTVIKGTTPITAEIYNEVALMINGLWYGTYDHYVDQATQKQTKLTAEIFNNLSTELNNYIARLV